MCAQSITGDIGHDEDATSGPLGLALKVWCCYAIHQHNCRTGIPYVGSAGCDQPYSINILVIPNCSGDISGEISLSLDLSCKTIFIPAFFDCSNACPALDISVETLSKVRTLSKEIN